MLYEGYWLKYMLKPILSKIGMLLVLQCETQLIDTPVSDFFQDSRHCILYWASRQLHPSSEISQLMEQGVNRT